MGVLRIGIVVDNWVDKKGFLAEHGLSLWVEYDGQRFLFDTGHGLVLMHNLEKMQLSLEEMDGVILSHGHYDHGNGLQKLVARLPQPVVYAHPQAMVEKIVKRKTGYHSVGFSYSQKDMEDKGVTFRLHSGPTQLGRKMIITGEIPQKNSYEEVGSNFYLPAREGGYRQDLMSDDQALLIKTPRGPVVILGCSHRGVINTLDYACLLLETDELYGVIGGMHLYPANKDRIRRTIEDLKRYNIKRLVPMHCSGFTARTLMAQTFPHSFVESGVGMIWEDFLEGK